MNINDREIKAVIRLPVQKRYSYFIKKVVSLGKIWGLYDDGWATSGTNDKKIFFPLWPAREYAKLCIGGEWQSYKPKAIELNEVLDSLMPHLREEGISPGVFFILEEGSSGATLDELERDLRTELSFYDCGWVRQEVNKGYEDEYADVKKNNFHLSVTKEKLEFIVKLPAPKRYSYFIKKVVGYRKAWGLYEEDNGWAMAETDDGKLSFPFWPAKEYAILCINKKWADYKPKVINLDEVLDEMIPSLSKSGDLPGVFFIPGVGGVSVVLDELESDLKEELSFYKYGWVRKEMNRGCEYEHSGIQTISLHQTKYKSDNYRRNNMKTSTINIHEKEIKTITQLPPSKRYDYFIEQVVKQKRMWALYEENNGWAMSGTDDGKQLFPLWPAKEYVELCIDGQWKNYEPTDIELHEVLDGLIPHLRRDGILPGVFFVPGEGSINITLDDLERDLREELAKYE